MERDVFLGWKVSCFGGQVFVSSTVSCSTNNVAIHELLHSAVLWHMHSRPDRDNYINIYLNNVKPALRYAINKMQGILLVLFISSRCEFYLFTFLMLFFPVYSMLCFSTAFSANGQPTMLRKDASKLVQEWQKPGMSAGKSRLYKA